MLLNLHQSVNWFLLDEEINSRLNIPKPKKVFTIFPQIVKKGNLITQKIYLPNKVQYQKLVEMGSEQQIKVLSDYLKHTPKDFHY